MQSEGSVRSSSEQSGLSASRPANPITHGPSSQNYMQRAKEILSDMEVVAPSKTHLHLMTAAALKAQQLFFAVSLFHPDGIDLDNFFDGFIRLCACSGSLEGI
jgi:hypothetical protein